MVTSKEAQIVAAKLTGHIVVEIAVGDLHTTHGFIPRESERVSANVIYDGTQWVVEVPRFAFRDFDYNGLPGIKLFDMWQSPKYAHPNHYVSLEPNHDPTKFPYSPNHG